MPTTVGRPPADLSFLDHWAQAHGESERLRVYGDPDESVVAPSAPEAADVEHRPSWTRAGALAAVADAMGVVREELSGDIGWSEPEDAAQRPEEPAEPPRTPEAQSRAYVVKEGNWRERHGIGRKRKSVPPSRTPEARRQRHLQQLVDAGKFASIQEAAYGAPKRQSFGKPKARKDKTE